VLIEGAEPAVVDFAMGKVAFELPSGCRYLALSPDGRFLFAAQHWTGRRPRLSCRLLNNLARLTWSINTTRLIRSPPLFLADGQRFVLFEWRFNPSSPDPYGPVYVTRDASNGELLSEVSRSLDDRFLAPTLSWDRRLIAARRAGWIGVFRADHMEAEPVTFHNDNRKEITALAFHPSGRFLAATSNDNTVKLFDTGTWKMASAFNWNIGRLHSLAFSPDGMLAAAGGDKGKIVLWDVDW
jgi:WD40 repeat protein